MNGRRTRNDIDQRYEEAKKLIAQGMTKSHAIAKSGLKTGTFYPRWNKEKGLKKKPNPFKPRPKLQVTDIPVASKNTNKLFCVIGDSESISQFIRSLQ